MASKRRSSHDLLSTTLLQLSTHDYLDMRQLLENVSILGQPGSCKTTSGARLAKAILQSGCGALVMCAKIDERALWERYCSETNRTGSLLIFDGKRHRYNFIAAELARFGIEGINTVIELIMQVMESAQSLSATASRGTDIFWQDIQKLILRHCLVVLYLARGTITIPDIIAFVNSAPRSREEADDPKWIAHSFFFVCLCDASDKMDERLRKQITSFWRDQWAGLDNKTRSNAAISLTTTLDRFNHGWLREAFCTDTTMTPELLMHGAVIVLDMPALSHMDDGILGQRLMKFITERVLLARQSYGPSHAERPVVIWMDEAPIFVDSHDAKFLALCRSTRSCMVLIAQSVPSYYAVMGENARDRVDQLLSNTATKIWFANNCPTTNKIASEMIGRGLQRRASFNQSEGSNSSYGMNLGDGTNWGSNSSSGGNWGSSSGQGGGSSSSGNSWSAGSSHGGSDNRGRNRGHGTNSSTTEGYSEQMDALVEPSAFSRLKTGGPANGGRVSAIIFASGRRYVASGGNPYLLVEFQQ